MNFNHYFNNTELESIIKEWVESHSEILQLQTIGNSYEGNPIWLLTLTNTATGSDKEKPAIWLDANIHATELSGTTTILLFLNHVLENYKKDEQITRLIDTSVFYIIPRINPDGAAAALDKNPRFLRSGVRPYPWFETDEGLHVQDIDGDSRILQMRIQDPNGDWKVSEQDQRLMVKREPAEYGGIYYRILPEGLIDNYDGYLINLAKPVAGLDFNRNFPFEWRPEDEQQGAGPFPASEPEISAIVRFAAEHRNISAALTFHTFSRVLLRPFSTKPDEQMEPADLEVYKTLGEIGTKLTGYRHASTFHDFTYHPKQVTTGAFDDWLYDHLGVFVYTVELWDLPTEAGIKDRKFFEWFMRHPVEDDQKIMTWVDENVGEKGYIPWYAFEHPQLGRVELGGWNSLFTWRNPPENLIAKESERHIPFILTLAELLPRITVHTLKTRDLGQNCWAVDLVVENNSYLPTYTSQQGKKRQAIRPVQAQIKLPEGGRITLGKERTEMGHLEGRSNKEDIITIFAASPTDNRAHVQWLIESPAGSQIEITVSSERAGQINRKLLLK
jgi:murein tripeptide amidase MpaA